MIAGWLVEDEAHRALLEPLLRRLARECGQGLEVRVRQADGGAGRTISSLRQYGRDLHYGLDPYLDLLVVAIDADRQRWQERRQQALKALGGGYPGRIVVAIPEPHIERR
ncbi:MAG TPA: hypothetical protein VFD01_09505 [Candidatus Dormibacteraeota bacterium]|nr:hypothetical protein [Candidatus Dormibacteraeota bacterium]